MSWVYFLVAMLAGVSNPLQSGSNSELLKVLGAPVVAGFIVYGIGALCLLALAAVYGFPAREVVGKLAGVPWWAFIGGICNALFLVSTLIVTKKLGSATFTTTVVVTAVITALVLDHFGLLGFEVRTASAGRLVGGALAIAGLICIAVF